MWQTRSDPVTQSYRDSRSQPVASDQRLAFFLFPERSNENNMSKIVKSKGVMISSIISLFLSLIVLATVSMAWLSMNKQTESDGMKLKVDVTPNLVISKSASALQALGGPTEADFSVSFVDSSATAVKPATHSASFGTTGLEYVSNQGDVSPTTGFAKSSASLTMTPVTSTDYYVDFTVYIASTGKAMDDETNQDLIATLAPPASISVGSSGIDTLKATSIDFYVGSVADGNYKGTLNVAGTNVAGTSPVTSVTLLNNRVIPLNTTGSNITVIMRCYIDGALVKSSGTAYINTATVDTSDITLNVTFSAVDHTP